MKLIYTKGLVKLTLEVVLQSSRAWPTRNLFQNVFFLLNVIVKEENLRNVDKIWISNVRKKRKLLSGETKKHILDDKPELTKGICDSMRCSYVTIINSSRANPIKEISSCHTKNSYIVYWCIKQVQIRNALIQNI